LSVSEKGVYIELVVRIWAENGALKNDQFLHRKINTQKQVFSDALAFFKELDIIQEENGFLSIKFIKHQLLEYDKFIEKKRLAGQQGGRPQKQTKANKKEERRKENEEIKENTTKENCPSFPISQTMETSIKSGEIKNLFINWLCVYELIHGTMTCHAQDGQIEKLLRIPAERRKQELKSAIAGQWKNITDTRKGDNDNAKPTNHHRNDSTVYEQVETRTDF
jgi:uncharacterized protein YdaU (DUF1376 family)